MATDFKVYTRKINVWVRQNSNVPDSQHTSHLMYMWSSHAYPTCKAAIAAAQALHPSFKFTANFDK
jgi:hypothetical protein